MGKDKLLKLFEFPQFVQIWVVDDQIESHVGQVHLFDDVIKFRSGKDFESIAVDVEDSIGFDLSVTALDQRFVAVVLVSRVFGILAVLFEVEALSLSLPLLLDDLDDCVLLGLPFGSCVAVFGDNVAYSSCWGVLGLER